MGSGCKKPSWRSRCVKLDDWLLLLSERVLLLGDGVIFRMCSVAWVCFNLSKPCLGPSTALSQAANAELQVPASVCCWRLLYFCTHVWNCSLVLDFQNRLPLSLLLQSKGSTGLKSKEWCNVWHELKTDVSVCLFLWVMPLLREQGLGGCTGRSGHYLLVVELVLQAESVSLPACEALATGE